jgi:hypothetical protein
LFEYKKKEGQIPDEVQVQPNQPLKTSVSNLSIITTQLLNMIVPSDGLKMDPEYGKMKAIKIIQSENKVPLGTTPKEYLKLMEKEINKPALKNSSRLTSIGETSEVRNSGSNTDSHSRKSSAASTDGPRISSEDSRRRQSSSLRSINEVLHHLSSRGSEMLLLDTSSRKSSTYLQPESSDCDNNEAESPKLSLNRKSSMSGRSIKDVLHHLSERNLSDNPP